MAGAVCKMPMMLVFSGEPVTEYTNQSSASLETPGPKNSTNFPTTPFLRSIWVTVSTRSVAVAPSGKRPERRKPMTSGISMGMG